MAIGEVKGRKARTISIISHENLTHSFFLFRRSLPGSDSADNNHVSKRDRGHAGFISNSGAVDGVVVHHGRSAGHSSPQAFLRFHTWVRGKKPGRETGSGFFFYREAVFGGGMKTGRKKAES